MPHLKHRMSEFKKGSISILLMLHEFGTFAHFTLVDIEFLIHFPGFSIFLLLKAAKNKSINKNIKTYFLLCMPSICLVLYMTVESSLWININVINVCSCLYLCVGRIRMNQKLCAFIKKGQNGKN